MSNEIEIERRGGALTLRLNRPDALNAWNDELATALLAALRDAAGDDSVRAVCLTGAGRAFSAGADLRSQALQTTDDGTIDLYTPMADLYGPVVAAVRAVPKPVVAALNGGAAGIGCSLALACDLVVAHESAYLLLAFVHVGLVPDGGAMASIVARAGAARATEMAMLGERIEAAQALEWGLVNRVLAADEFEPGVVALMDRLAAGPTLAHAGTKRQLNSWLYPRLEEQLELEALIQQEMAGTADFVEGVTAFAQKRPPAFDGR